MHDAPASSFSAMEPHLPVIDGCGKVDIAGSMLSHKLSKLPLVEQERIRAEFFFQGFSLGVDKNMEILRAIRLSQKLLKNQIGKGP